MWRGFVFGAAGEETSSRAREYRVVMIREVAIVVLFAACSSQSAAGVDAGKTAVTSADSGLPDGALVFTGKLPACTVPASVNGAARTFLACADCFAPSGGTCSIGVADNATDCQSCGACVMACEPDEYAVLSEEGGGETLPAGCGADLPVMQRFLEDYAASGGSFVVRCCPCE